MAEHRSNLPTPDRLVRRLGLLGLSLAALGAAGPVAAFQGQGPLRTRNVVLIMTDGLRWQEVFRGADSALISRKAGGVRDTAALRHAFWRADRGERRRALLPFLWDSIAARGQIFGDRDSGSAAQVTNGLKFSYPGYNETLTGHADARIHSNNAGPNPNRTVFEWVAHQKGFEGQVAAFGTWNEFGDIFNRARAGLPVFAGWEDPLAGLASLTPAERQLEWLYANTTRLWDDLAYDAFMQRAVVDYVERRRPRLLFVGYGETDEWAHDRRYDQTLASAHRVDQFVGELWRTLQELPQYRDRTTFVILTDHGRGRTEADWIDHGEDVAGAEEIWLAVLGPDTPPLGERKHTAPVTQAQVAATVAELLGLDYRAADALAAPPIAEVVRPAP